MNRINQQEQDWLVENYLNGTIHDTLDAFEDRFGWRPTARTLYQRAFKLGLRKELQLQDKRIRTDRAQVRIVWSKEPEMEAWMLEHDTGGHQSTIEAFEDRFGIRLSRGQINIFRASHGTQQKRSKGGRSRRPIGFERKTKGGILVKVAEEATVPMSKDNWRYKHHIAYEEAYGPIPEGHQVYAVDGDVTNCEPGNLVAVPKRAIGALGSLRREGYTWKDREGMIAVVNLASLKVGINDAEHIQFRTCEVCGKKFQEPEERRRCGTRAKTCPACVKAGKRARGERKAQKGPLLRICKVCGKEFEAEQARQVRCRSCIDKAPKYEATKQKRMKRK